jgi:hypothetical protein
MNKIFQDLIMEGVMCLYLNNIFIFMKTIEEHCHVTCLVLQQLQENNLFLWHDKCKFECMMIKYLGLIISLSTIAMDLVKVTGVVNWPTPKMKKEVQSFLGFMNFYHRFIKWFSHYAQPLFDLTKRDVMWNWGAEQQAAFDELKTHITSSPVLTFTDDSLQFHVEADSSDFTTGMVLSQQSPVDSKWHLLPLPPNH